jgi:uncharacterized membrane protein YhaH (DUF805 family)
MGFSEAVRTCLFEKYVTFSGRASRSEYWYFILFYFLVMLALMLVFMLVGGGLGDFETGEISGLAYLPSILMGLFALGMFLPGISVAVRRFHDRNLSGWWYLAVLVASFIPLVGLLAAIAAFVIFVLKGTPGANKFGRDPLGADTNADVFA